MQEPQLAALALCAGILLVCWEFCHPGQVLPGVLLGETCSMKGTSMRLQLAALFLMFSLPAENWYRLFGWLAWMGLHLMLLVGFRNRVVVFINWVWNYINSCSYVYGNSPCGYNSCDIVF